jgi:hypothetical protein
VLPQLLACGACGKQLLAHHTQQRLLEGIELARSQPPAVGQARRRPRRAERRKRKLMVISGS